MANLDAKFMKTKGFWDQKDDEEKRVGSTSKPKPATGGGASRAAAAPAAKPKPAAAPAAAKPAPATSRPAQVQPTPKSSQPPAGAGSVARYANPPQDSKIKPLQQTYQSKVASLFHAADMDGDNSLNRSELEGVLQALEFYFSPGNLSLVYALADSDESGSIELDEFVGLITYLSAMEQVFTQMDLNGDGRFDRLELALCLMLMDFNFDAGQQELLYLLADDDDSGFVDKEEFAALVLFLAHLRILFDRADKDWSGTLELHEFFPFLTHLGINVPRQRAAAAFAQLDVDGTGSLSFEDTVAFVMLLKYKDF